MQSSALLSRPRWRGSSRSCSAPKGEHSPARRSRWILAGPPAETAGGPPRALRVLGRALRVLGEQRPCGLGVGGREIASEVGLGLGDRGDPLDRAGGADLLGVVGQGVQRAVVGVDGHATGLLGRRDAALVQLKNTLGCVFQAGLELRIVGGGGGHGVSFRERRYVLAHYQDSELIA